MSSHPKFVSRLFLKNVNKMNYIGTIRFQGVRQKSHFLQFHRQNKIDDFISFTNTWSRDHHSEFFEFLKNKYFRSKSVFFGQKITFFAYYLFVLHVFTGKRLKTQKLQMLRSRQFNFLQNDVCFSLPRSKTVEGDAFLVTKSVIFRGRKKHIKT